MSACCYKKQNLAFIARRWWSLSGHDRQANDSYCPTDENSIDLHSVGKAKQSQDYKWGANIYTYVLMETYVPVTYFFFKYDLTDEVYVRIIKTFHGRLGISQFSHLCSISAFSAWPAFQLYALTERLIQGISNLSVGEIRGRISRWHHCTRLRRKPLPMVVNIMTLSVTSQTMPYFYRTLCRCPQTVTVALPIIFIYWRYSGIGSFEQTIWREFHTHIIVSTTEFCFSIDKFSSTEMAVVRRKYKGHEPVYVQNVISPLCLFFDVTDISSRWHHRRLPPSPWNQINSVFPAWSL
jgi:hypothetical protein